mgnify:CR=1 FL=1
MVIKKLLSILSIVILVTSLVAHAPNVYADGCTHSGSVTLLATETICSMYSTYEHTLQTTKAFCCNTCNAIFYRVTETKEYHSMSGYSYTGNNYHSGTKHYFQYERHCTTSGCGHTETKWRSANCSGGNHILPLSIQPIAEIE